MIAGERPLLLNLKSCFLFGSDETICDFYIPKGNLSKQHCVIQFRLKDGIVKPFLMDLESEAKTFINGQEIEPARYYELLEKDVLRLGSSDEEFVVMSRDN